MRNPFFTLRIASIASFVLSAFMATGCFENNIGTTFNKGGTTSTLSTTGNTLTSSGFTISNVTIAASSSTTATANNLTSIFFVSGSANSITNYCASTTGSASQTCVCNFSWQQQLSTDGSVAPIQRTVQSSLITVQPNLVTCNAPEVYNNEIPTGTVIAISVVPGSGNASSFGMTAYNYTKSSSATGGSFSDSQGNSFQNIFRYSCYEESQKGMSIGSMKVPLTNPTSGASTTMYSATSLCVETNGQVNTNSNCTGQLLNPDFTAQSNYYNLYIRQSEVGDINLGNDIYHCPQVKEALNNNGTVGTQGLAWPLDSSFALAMSASASFNIGVQAFSKVSDGSDPVSANSGSCFTTATPSPGTSATGTTTTTSSSNDLTSLVNSCLGFAMTPNVDGSCPYFKNSSNQVVFTYRLRRYIALYPKSYDTNGFINPQAPNQAVDTVYVIDRPVTSPNPLVPYTMKGPKPCPFSYFDKAGVTNSIPDPAYNYYNGSNTPNACVSQTDSTNGSRPTYAATNNTFWTGTNFDGIQFPNKDTANSCAAVLSVLDQYKQYMSIATISPANPQFTHQYVRPVTAWAPHYEEDTSFQACAPLANPFKDPPLHFAKDSSGNVSWCAEAYPTQNQNIAALDKISIAPIGTYPTSCPQAAVNQYVGRVENYTSPVVKNSASSVCVATVPSPIPSNYPAANTGVSCPLPSGSANPQGVARHPIDQVVDTITSYPGNVPTAVPTTSNVCATQTCDRTVMSTGVDWQRFPLQARPAEIEAAITNDKSYNCTITYDSNGPKTGKVTPTGGCCGPVVYMKTGLGGNTSAHLEPDVSCVTPTY